MTHYTPLFIHIESDVKQYKYMYGTFCEMLSHQEYKQRDTLYKRLLSCANPMMKQPIQNKWRVEVFCTLDYKPMCVQSGEPKSKIS